MPGWLDSLMSGPRRFIKDLKETDPIVGQRRQKLVAKHYGPDNTFRQGQDAVGNGVIALATTLAGAGGVASAAKLLASQGAKAIPIIASAVAGGYIGSDVADALCQKVNGKTWAENARDIGMSQYNQVTTNPGGWAGSYTGSYMANGVINNFTPWMYNTTPRAAMTPKGPVRLQPGETYTYYGEPVSYQTNPQGRTGYQARYTSKPSGARGSSAGQGGHSTSSPKTGSQTVSRGYSNRGMIDVQSGNSGYNMDFGFDMLPYTQASGFAIPFGNYAEPVVMTAPSEGHRYEQYSDPDAAFLRWYSKQPEGTTQEYEGDPYHKKGSYKISRKAKDPERTVRRVGNEQGYVARDSTTTLPYRVIPTTNMLQGAVDPSAVILPVKLTGFKRGGKFKRRIKL